MRRRSVRIPVALAWTALGGGGLCVALSCGSGTEPPPTCPPVCTADAAPEGALPPDARKDALPTPDGPRDVVQEFPVV